MKKIMRMILRVVVILAINFLLIVNIAGESKAKEQEEVVEDSVNQLLQEKQLLVGYDVTEYGILPTNKAVSNGEALYNLIAKVEQSGGGTIYFPAGEYNINNTNNYMIRSDNIRILGDGGATKLVRWGKSPLFNVVGISIKNKLFNGMRLYGTQIENVLIVSGTAFEEGLHALVVLESCSGVRINNVTFRGAGTHIDFIECFDSKIISTDFELSGKSYKANNQIKNDVIDYYNKNNDDYYPAVRFCSNVESKNQQGYSTLIVEATNQIHFIGCRFESFYGGAVGVKGEGTNGIYFKNCKFESKMSTVPFFVLRHSFTASSIDNCFLCKFPKSSNGTDLSRVPVIYSDALFLTNKIDINMTVEVSDDTVMNTDLIKLNQNTSYSFGANTIQIRMKSSSVDGRKLLADGYYVVETPLPHELYLNGNETEVHNYNSYGMINIDYKPLQEILGAPTQKWHKEGEVIEFSMFDENGNTKAICVESGTPGTWILK